MNERRYVIMNINEALEYFKKHNKCFYEYIQTHRPLVTDRVIIGYAEHMRGEL